MKKSGFTLAEVLITLGIIGIVAAMTLPALMQNYQKNVYVNGYKQAFSMLNTLTLKIMAEDGVDDMRNTSFYINAFNNVDLSNKNTEFAKSDLDSSSQSYENYMKKELGKYIKLSVYTCQEKDTFCQPVYLGGNKDSADIQGRRLIKLANGMLMRFSLFESVVLNSKMKPSTRCGWVMIDVNGVKSPNKVGRDNFTLWLGCDGKWYPQGGIVYAKWTYGDEWQTSYAYWLNTTDCNPNVKSAQGHMCAARVIEEGWEMNY